MAQLVNPTEESLPATLAETSGALIVGFWAEWCGPCHVVAPMLERLSHEHPEVTIAKVNVDHEPALASEHGIQGIPTLIRFDGGTETLRVTGAVPYGRLRQALGIDPRISPAAA
jgi:thioredoxin 1